MIAMFVYALWAVYLALYVWAICYAISDLFRRVAALKPDTGETK